MGLGLGFRVRVVFGVWGFGWGMGVYRMNVWLGFGGWRLAVGGWGQAQGVEEASDLQRRNTGFGIDCGLGFRVQGLGCRV